MTLHWDLLAAWHLWRADRLNLRLRKIEARAICHRFAGDRLRMRAIARQSWMRR